MTVFDLVAQVYSDDATVNEMARVKYLCIEKGLDGAILYDGHHPDDGDDAFSKYINNEGYSVFSAFIAGDTLTVKVKKAEGGDSDSLTRIFERSYAESILDGLPEITYADGRSDDDLWDFKLIDEIVDDYEISHGVPVDDKDIMEESCRYILIKEGIADDVITSYDIRRRTA